MAAAANVWEENGNPESRLKGLFRELMAPLDSVREFFTNNCTYHTTGLGGVDIRSVPFPAHSP